MTEPTREQLDNLLDHAHKRRLGPDEVGRIRDGIANLRQQLALSQAGVLREAIDVAREEANRLETQGNLDHSRGARCVAYLLRRRLAKEPAAPLTDQPKEQACHPDSRTCILCGADCTNGWTSHGGDRYSCCPACPAT